MLGQSDINDDDFAIDDKFYEQEGRKHDVRGPIQSKQVFINSSNRGSESNNHHDEDDEFEVL